jgi:hypothetical protein
LTKKGINNIFFLFISAVFSLLFIIACLYSPRTGDTLVYINMFSKVYWDSFHNQPLFSILRNLTVMFVDDAVAGIFLVSYIFLFSWVFTIFYKFRSFSVIIVLTILVMKCTGFCCVRILLLSFWQL